MQASTWTVIFGAAPGPGLLFGLILLAALVGGYAARMVHAPRVVGYLLGGMALKEMLTRLLAGHLEVGVLAEAAAPLEAIRELALGMILFSIGSVFERSRLRAAIARVVRIALLEITAVLVLVFAGCCVALWLGGPSVGFGDGLVLAVLLGTAAVATAPAATLSVLQEYEAKGPITETILGVTGVNNIVCIVLFHVAFLTLSATGLLAVVGGPSGSLGWSLLATTMGSVVLGLAFGLLVSLLHWKLPLAETLIVFFAMLILAGAGEAWLVGHGHGISHNFLLTSLVMGAVFANSASEPGKLAQALRTTGAPILAAFFVMAGYDLHLADLQRMGWLGAAYVLCRFFGKELGAYLGVRWAAAPARTGGRLGEGLLCQAAVVIGLASHVAGHWDSPLAREFSTIVLGSVVVFELTGPLLLKRRVVQGGEVKAITLLRRGGARRERPSFLGLALRPLLQAIGARRDSGGADAAKEMRVHHIMRTNAQFIGASASLDDVLHFIERSTYAHFPVVCDEGRLVGVIHFSDVRDVIYDPTLATLVTAEDLADADSPTVPPDMPLGDLLAVFSRENVGVLPVVEARQSTHVLGVVEQRDLLRALHRPELSG